MAQDAADRELRVRHLARERRGQSGGHAGLEIFDDADTKGARAQQSTDGRGARRPSEMAQALGQVMEDFPALAGEAERPRRAIEQSRAELLLQPRDVMRYRGYRQLHFERRLSHRP